MTRRFCVVCGKATDELIHNVCVECFKKEKNILRLPEKLRGEVCGSCGARKYRGTWIEPTAVEEKAVVKAAEVALRESMALEAKDADVKIALRDVKKSSDRVYHVRHLVTADGMVDGVALSSEATSDVEVRAGICDDCTRVKSGYFEAVLQVRGEDGLTVEQRRMAAEVIEEQLQGKPGKMVFVAKVEELKEGVDYYMGTAKTARKFARVLQQKFGGKVTESAKLFGKKDGKDIYRVNIAVRLPLRAKH